MDARKLPRECRKADSLKEGGTVASIKERTIERDNTGYWLKGGPGLQREVSKTTAAPSRMQNRIRAGTPAGPLTYRGRLAS